MNRLTPLIVRRVGARALAASPDYGSFDDYVGGGDWLADARVFVTAWVGGLIFISTLFG